MGVLNQVVTRFQETKKQVTMINDKANTSLEQRDLQVKFLDNDNTIKEADLVVVEVIHLLHSLIMTDDVNTYQSGSHLRHMMRAHTWKSEMQKLIDKVGCCVVANKPRFSKMLHELELKAKFLDENFEEQVAAFGPPSS